MQAAANLDGGAEAEPTASTAEAVPTEPPTKRPRVTTEDPMLKVGLGVKFTHCIQMVADLVGIVKNHHGANEQQRRLQNLEAMVTRVIQLLDQPTPNSNTST